MASLPEPKSAFGDEPPAKPKKVLNAQEQAYKDRARAEDKRFMEAVDTNYWFCLCFQTEAHKQEFLEKSGWGKVGDKYIDGLQVAASMNVTLDQEVPPIRKSRPNRRMERLAP